VTNGNDHEIQTYGGFTYAYIRDQELRQISATGLTYDVAYDALGRCVKRTVNNTTTTYYIYDGEKPILEYNVNNALVGLNLYGKRIDEIIERGAYGTDDQWYWYFLNQDAEGSVTHLTDASGSVIERYRYDVFGAPSIYAPNGSGRSSTIFDNRFLFTGREYAATYRSTYISTFNVYEYRARAYNPALGRFMSEDPKLFDPGDYNLFRYCHNDPVDFTDPMGLEINWSGAGPQNPQNQAAVARYKEMRDDTYNRSMANAQRTMSGAHGGAIGIGKAAYQTWSAIQRTPIAVVSRIEGPYESGRKTVQRLTVDNTGGYEVSEPYVGRTRLAGLSVRGDFTTMQKVTTSSSEVIVQMRRQGKTQYFPRGLSIDYNVALHLNFARHTVSVYGFHDGYPSYLIKVGGTPVYHFTERHLWDLARPMEVPVSVTNAHW
jgi:RHS repeat-associated protein